MNYVAMVEKKNMAEALKAERFYLDFRFQREKSSSWRPAAAWQQTLMPENHGEFQSQS